MRAGSDDVSTKSEAAARALREAVEAASRNLVGRRVLVEMAFLAGVASEHLLVIGPPGTAKSQAVRRVADALGGRCFEYLLSRFTEPSELFGPVDLRKLRDGVVETNTEGMLPEAEVAFLDEVFLGSTAILNTLLTLLNERTFRRGRSVTSVPLRLCVGASNGLPAEESLAAFADRFLLRVFVDSVGDPHLEELLENGWHAQAPAHEQPSSIEHLDTLASVSRRASLDAARPELAHAVRKLRAAGIQLSDRRIVKLQRLIAAAAALDGRLAPGPEDLWPIVYAVPTSEAQELARDVLRGVLDRSRAGSLVAAAEQASAGPLARAERLAAQVRAVLDDEHRSARSAAEWRSDLESLAREIDATFAKDAVPEPLGSERARLVAALETFS